MLKRQLVVLLFLGLLIFVLNNCMDIKREKQDIRGAEYAGSAQCRNCHRDIYNAYLKTAHNHTSAPATTQTIAGSFVKDSNLVMYRPSLEVKMESSDSGLYQVAYLDGEARQKARFDMVMGSGSKGQSYLSWLDNTVFQLPVSYFVPGRQWINSPGYPPKYILFNRNIPVGCFECHSSYIKRTSSEPVNGYLIDHFDKTQIVYGIDCERCHGPLAAHVKYQEENPATKTAEFVVNIASLTRRQKTDLCAVCHSGAGKTVSSPFYYKPGGALSGYMHIDNSSLRAQDIDVHGKQYQLLSGSQCFIKSQTLTCVTCHNPHQDMKNQIQAFSAVCLTCHRNPVHTSLTFKIDLQNKATLNCIDCHMPAKPSRVITMKSSSQNDSVSAFVRTHRIAVYKDALRTNGDKK